MAGGDTLRVIDDHPCNARNVLGKPATEPCGLIAMWIEDPTDSASSWSRFPPITLSAVTRATKMTTDTRQMSVRSRQPVGTAAGYTGCRPELLTNKLR
jgi:hypothetical protein